MSRAAAILLRLPADDTPALVRFDEPIPPAPLLAATPPDLVPELIGRLFSVCARAQAHAARLAIAAASGRSAPRTDPAAGESAVWREIVREHGLRICLDWTRLTGEPADAGTARRFIAAAGDGPAAIAALIAERITGGAPERWLAIEDAAALARWAAAGETAAARFFAALAAIPPLAAPVEATSLAARNRDHPLLGALPQGTLCHRHAARLIDLCRAPARIAALESGAAAPLSGSSAAPGIGEAEVPCSRGGLIHRAELRDERVAAYRILSPTTRLFGAGGPAARHVAQLAGVAHAQRARCAEFLMQALDPCVDYAIEVA